MKRVLSQALNCVANNTRSKKPRLYPPLNYINRESIWVAATHLRNYVMKDPIVDWLALSSPRKKPAFKRKSSVEDTFQSFIQQKGIDFEDALVEYIHSNKIKVVSVSEYHTKEAVKKTEELMRRGVPVIHSAPVTDPVTNTGGIIDLLVRSDYIGRIVKKNPLTKAEQKISARGLYAPYHYVVIDVKFSTLPLRADGRFLLNSGSYPTYKAQTWIYTQAVGRIQGYTPRYAFIMGRRWRYKKTDIDHHGYSCLDKLGVIDFQGVDSHYIDLSARAVNWVRDVKTYGHLWSVNPPSREELYPNMCVDSGKWNAEKEKIAFDLGEITSVWYCGYNHRLNAFENNVRSWRDKRCLTENLGIRGVRAETIDAILDINRQERDLIRPTRIETNIYDWRKNVNEVFVDFETLADIFCSTHSIPEQPQSDMIFMIGVGWVEAGEWKYKSFTCQRPTYDEEFRVMNEFSTLMSEMGMPKMWYWCAEDSFWNRAECRQFDLADQSGDIERKDMISDSWTFTRWSDMCGIFKTEPIVIKDCFKYGLKSIAAAMKSHGMIDCVIESECSSGMTAQVKAWKCYQAGKDVRDSDVMKDIEKYNQFDCRVLWEIITFLRKKC